MSRSGGEGRAEWVSRLARHRESISTVAQFCASEEVSVAQFYYWKRKLTEPGGAVSEGEAPGQPAGRFRPVDVVGRNGDLAGRPTTVRLPAGIHIELGDDLATVDQVIASILHQVRSDNGRVARLRSMKSREAEC